MSENQSQSQSQSQSQEQLSVYELFLLNMLDRMYNNNIQQINRLTNVNYEILNTINSLLRQPHNNRHNNNNNSHSYNNNNHHNNNQYNNNRQNNYNNRQNNQQNNQQRVYLNNRPYLVDNIQHLYIPPLTNNTNTNTNNTNNTSNSIIQPIIQPIAPRQPRQPRQTNNQRSNNITQLLQTFFEPIEVYPTQSQIEIATRIVTYRDIVSPMNTSCPITLERFNDDEPVTIIRHCSHIFNTIQLNSWFRTNCKCPVCRYDIRTYIPNRVPQSETLQTNNSLENQEVERNIITPPISNIEYNSDNESFTFDINDLNIVDNLTNLGTTALFNFLNNNISTSRHTHTRRNFTSDPSNNIL